MGEGRAKEFEGNGNNAREPEGEGDNLEEFIDKGNKHRVPEREGGGLGSDAKVLEGVEDGDGLGDSLDIVAEILAVPLDSAPAQSLAKGLDEEGDKDGESGLTDRNARGSKDEGDARASKVTG